MKVLVASDVRIAEKAGRYYAEGQVASIIKRYHNAFGMLAMYCRIIDGEDIKTNYQDITDCVEKFLPVSSLMGALTGADNKRIKALMQEYDLVIGRLHSMVGCVAADCARKLGKPFFAEVMGDAWDAYWNHSLAGKMIAPYMFWKTKQAVKNADYALYVTSEFLQNRYPCKNPSVGVSNVRIDSVDPQILEKRLEKIRNYKPGELSLMTTAAVDVRYKGQEYVIRAIPTLNRVGIRVKYTLVGGGDPAYLQQVAKKCGVEDQVVFVGRKNLDEVFTMLDEADIYVQPSLQEGLPRSVIEAMSRGCPAIGARTAGIPELIAPECVVRRKSINDIAETIIKIGNAEKLTVLANENFENAKAYLDTVLGVRRGEYFATIKQNLAESVTSNAKHAKED